MEEEDIPNIDHDGNWKLLIHNLPFDFMDFFLPLIAPDIDKSVPPVFMDKEFHKIMKDLLKSGVTIKDKLMQVKTLDGEDYSCIIHIEVQSSFEMDFAERMYLYFIRLFDKGYRNIAAMAVYTGDELPKKHKEYNLHLPYAKASYEFGVYKVREADEAELLKSSNFALAVLACKYINKSKGNNDLRLQFKRKLFNLCLERNYNEEQIGFLINFIEFMLILPKDMEKELKHEILTTHGKMASAKLILPENYDYPLADFVHRIVHGYGLDELVEREQKEQKEALRAAEKARKAEEKLRKAAEKARKAEEKLRKAAEEKLQIVENNQRIVENNQKMAVNKLSDKGFSVEEIAQLLNLPIEKVCDCLDR